MSSFVEVLLSWYQNHPSKMAYSFLDDKGDVLKSVTYRQLLQKSCMIADHLRGTAKLNPGDRVLLVYPPSLDFIVAFIGCLMAGIVAVPTFPPDPNRIAKDTVIFNSIAASSGATCALTSNLYKTAVKVGEWKHLIVNGESNLSSLNWITTDSLLVTKDKDTEELNIDHIKLPKHEEVAFLQYTSGSTSEPKGVIITHGNLFHNLNLIITGLKAKEDTVVVSWLPQYHDMGLIGSYLGALFCGGCGYYMSPYTFIRNPAIWILCMSRYKATHIQAPNFAYTLTARKVLARIAQFRKLEGRDKVDLSNVRHMINAAEPVESTSIESFYAVFCEFGLKRGVICPTYGLAEHTVYVCSNGTQRLVVDKKKMEESKEIQIVPEMKSKTSAAKRDKTDGRITATTNSTASVVLMGCGKPSDSSGVDLRIVNPESGEVVGEDKVGEIWISSSSTAAGYWGNVEKSKADFKAILSGSNAASGGYLRTGDLGFLHEGELFVCGRLKDLIIIRGRNHYPQDIERTCEAINAASGFATKLELRGGCSAAFSLSVGGNEVLIYIAELGDACKGFTEKEGEAFVELLRREVNLTHGVAPSVIQLLTPRTIPKTSSGKIARQWVRKAYLEGTLKAEVAWSDLDSINSNSSVVVIPSVSLKAQVEANEDGTVPIDPTGQPVGDVLAILTNAVSKTLGRDASSISTFEPLARLGMDSMQSIQLQSILDSSFSVGLPDELLFETDATLVTLAEALVSGGVYRHRPIMLLGSDIYEAARANELAKPYNKTFLGAWFGLDLTPQKKANMKDLLSPQWFREHQLKSHVDTHSFPDGCALKEVPMQPLDDPAAIIFSLGFFGVFMWLPIFFISVFVLFSFKVAVAVLVVFFTFTYGIPFDCYPACFRTGWSNGMINRYYSFRYVVEAPTESYESVPSIYALGPHGVFSIAPAHLTLMSEYILGENFHFLAATAALYVPVYNIYLKLMGFKSVDRKPFKDTLLSGRSVALIPGGIAEMFTTNDDHEVMMVKERKGFVAIALETGSQIVPCYCFGNSQLFWLGSNRVLEYLSRVFRMSLIIFWGRYGLPVPNRKPLLTVVGKPIIVPKVENPSPELINDYHEQYLRETRRIYDQYKNAYNWQDRKLVFKR